MACTRFVLPTDSRRMRTEQPFVDTMLSSVLRLIYDGAGCLYSCTGTLLELQVGID